MINYDTVPNTSGSFPNVVGVNASGPGAIDGTPWFKILVDDLFGARQAIMDDAGLTPDAVTESATASQFLEAVKKASAFPGQVIAWMGNDADPGVALGVRLLPLTGQAITIANYQELVDVVYVGDPDNPTAPAFYKTSDAGGTIRDTAGTYMVMPDERGRALRGLDPSGTIDPDGASRSIGDDQIHSLEEHRHQVIPHPVLATHTRLLEQACLTGAGTTIYAGNSGGGTDTTEVVASEDFISIAAHNPDETRMRNSACRWVISY